MILRPTKVSYQVIAFYTGKVILGVGLLMVIPLLTAIGFQEWDAAVDFVISIALSLIIGFATQAYFRTEKDLNWGEGLVVSAGSWFWAVLLAAMPYWLSGHLATYLDACFDTMSGFTTTGLFMMQDLDHISVALNMWRHLITFAGGQGIVVIALTFLFRGTAGAYKLYVGEGKDERLLPNVVQTARAIWLVSTVYLILGTLVLWLINLYLGFEPVMGFFDAAWSFMTAWSTGGFAPSSFNGMYYHSAARDIVMVIVMMIGTMNFALHWAIWTGKRREILKNLEIQTFAVTIVIFSGLAIVGLAKAGVYEDALSMVRKVAVMMASAHTTTGMATIYSRAFVTEWGPIGLTAAIFAMMVGGSACSTSGGIKAIRVGLIAKSTYADIRASILPESAVIKTRYHHIKDSFLNEPLLRAAYTIVVLYLAVYLFSAVVGTFYGYDFLQSLFEGVSAASNSGLSCGLTSPAMPEFMKVLYLFTMWLGRLEFVSAFALGGHFISVFKGK